MNMKQKFFYLAVAALAMASCSQDETVEINKGRGISFRAESGASTRAIETTNENLESFWVTAVYDADGAGFFSDVEFKENSGTYTSTPAYNWPGSGTLAFYAVSPSKTDLGGTFILGKNEQKVTGFSLAGDIASQKDFIYATATGSKENNEASGVGLTFNHMLSQIEVKAKSESEAYTYKVKGVKIAEISSTADATLAASPAWSNLSEKKDFEVTLTDEITLGVDATSLMVTADGNAMLIPQQLTAWDVENDEDNTDKGAYLGVYLQITTTKGGNRVYPKGTEEYAYAAVPIDTKWEAGKHYVYTLDFTKGAGYVAPEDPDEPGTPILGEPIKFMVTVQPWNTKDAAMDVEM